MKKLLFVIAIVVFGFSASAQDSFFRADEGFAGGSRTGESAISNTTPALPHGTLGMENGDKPAPVGSGIIILTALGAGYAISRRNTRRGN